MIGLGPVAAREIAGLAAWFYEELVVFSSSFLCSRFAAAGALRDKVTGNEFEHLIDEFLLLARCLASGCYEP